MRCERCINDKSVRKISFDHESICNYCRNYETIADQIQDYEHLEKLFKERIKRIKGKYDYDAAVGISGGKDSVFVLEQLVNRYHLKVKTFTMNNGFLTDAAKQNIDRVVQEFGVEHEYIDYEQALLRKVYKLSMKYFLVPCVACSYVGYASMIGYAAKINAGMCIHGRSPEQMLRYYDTDMFSQLVKLGLKSINNFDLQTEYAKLFAKLKKKIHKAVFAEIQDAAFGGLEGENFREFVPYFLYHDYDEAKIVAYLKDKTEWEPPADYNHYDCGVKTAAKYIYQCAEGRPHVMPEISVLIRTGKISREKGLELLKQAEIAERPDAEINQLCEFTDTNQKVLFMKAKLREKVRKK